MKLSSISIIALIISVSAVAQNAPPAGGGIGALLQAGVEGPVVVMDLVKFKSGGEAKYDIYDGIAEEKVKSLGGAVVFRGTAREVPGMKSGSIDSQSWDRVTFRKYPSMQAVMAMAASTEYQGAFPNRLASVENSFVYAFSGELPSFEGGPPPGNFPMPNLQPPPSSDTVYMLNLLRFTSEAGREQYYSKYGAATSPLINKRGGGAVYFLKGVGPVISDEKIDRLILVTYPSTESFVDMITSDEYRAIAHLRTDAIELGLLFPFSYK